MAKMFYTPEEAAERLGVTETELKEMVSKGQLSEFRDRNELRFKVEQVDMLATGHEEEEHDDDFGVIPLSDTGGGTGLGLAADSGLGLSRSGSGSGIDVDDFSADTLSAKEQSGISIFDADEETADASAETLITEAGPGGGLTMDAVGSGSGLLDLTREADDTSLGADLLDDVYADGGGSETQGSSGLFETTGAASDVSSSFADAPVAMVAGEPLDNGFSGFTGGVMLGVAGLLAVTLAVSLTGLTGTTAGGLSEMLGGDNLLIFVGGAAAAVVVFGVAGWLIGRKN
jgi:excisionase family DNA binding protein